MDVIVERPGALDVHKAQVTACVRVLKTRGGASSRMREFKTTVGGLLVLRDWLKAHGVTQVAMEATGVYWKPVWTMLEDDFDCLLVNARHVKQVPGRKTDVKDAEWLCRLTEAGLLRGSLVLSEPIRELRQLARYRKAQIAERQREANRLHKALEDTGIKLDCVATDILGVSGRAMLDALINGTTDPVVLADLAKGRMRAKIPALREALEGRFDELHALLIGAILAHLDFLDQQIEVLSGAIEVKLSLPFAAAVDLLRTIPGIEVRTAQNVIAEIGTDMTQFPSADHLASWVCQSPEATTSPPANAAQARAARARNGSTRRSRKPRWLRSAPTTATCRRSTAARSPRLGHARALGAVKHSILCAMWHMLTTGELYRDLGGDYYQRRDPERQTRRLVAQLERLGHKVTLEELPQAA